jgi:hypothetical protein
MSLGNKKYALGLAAVALMTFIGWYSWGTRRLPLITLDQNNLGQFNWTFDSSPKDTRLVLLLSPT